MKKKLLKKLTKALPVFGLVGGMSLSFGLIQTSSAEAATFTVNQSNDNDNGPASCPTTCSIRDAINAANDGDTIIIPTTVSPITFTSGIGEIQISKSITIQGEGGSKSILDGNSNTRVFRIGDDSSIVPSVVIDGIAIQNANADWGAGGAIRLGTGSSLVLKNSIIGPNNYANRGGGVSSRGAGFLTIINTLITSNKGRYGGGVFCDDATVTIKDSRISNNLSNTYGGGGIYNDGCSMTIIGTADNSCIIDGNVAQNGYNGGGVNSYAGTTLIDNCNIFGNSVEDGGYGGGVYNDDNLVVRNSQIFDNHAKTGSYGGGIYNDYGMTLDSTSVRDNSADDDGGGIYINGPMTISNSKISNNTSNNGTGGGIYNNNHTVIHNSTISDNKTLDNNGGGIYNDGDPMLITNSTISGNQALGSNRKGGGFYSDYPADLLNVTIFGNTATGHGGGIYSEDNDVHLNNVTVANNTADSDKDDNGDGGGVYLNGVSLAFGNTIIAGNSDLSPSGAVDKDCSTTTANSTMNSEGHNLIQVVDANCVIAGNVTGNITGQDPLLDPAGLQANNSTGPLTVALLSGSPAINQADSVTALPEDARGVARPQEAAPDMGAFEFVPATVTPPPVVPPTPVTPSDTNGGGCSLGINPSQTGIASFLLFAPLYALSILGIHRRKKDQ